MRVMQSDLAILNAAQYEDGPRYQQGRTENGHKKSPPTARNGADTKKRPRVISVDESVQDEPEEEKKRARGRPRLDPTDQTPQDRRRTQIRLAQRAYRDRKESAISTLEKEVDGLKETNHQMSLAYHDLFQHALKKGLLEEDPEFGQRLLALDALTKASTDSGSGKGDEADSSDSATGSSEAQSKTNKLPSNRLNASAPQPQQPQQPQHLWGGIIVSHEASNASPRQLDHATSHMSKPTGASSLGYQIVAQPDVHNASFPRGIEYNQTNVFHQGGFNAASFPWHPLASPNTYAWNELTFGRQLHRTALQYAARLISMPDPPPDKLMRVFGFSRLFETYEQIKERTLAIAGLTTSDDLSFWRYPMQTLGGAGTHFPSTHSQIPQLRTSSTDSSSDQSIPRSGRSRPFNPFPHGPVDERTDKVRTSLLGLGNNINIPGFDGVFWDPDEVDYYLTSNGVNIPPLCDHWVVEIEDGAFAGPPGEVTSEAESQPPEQIPTTTASWAASTGGLSTPLTAGTSSTAPISASRSTPETSNGSSVSAQDWQTHVTSAGTEPWAQPFRQAAVAEEMTHVNKTTLTPYQDPPLMAFVPHHQHAPFSPATGAVFASMPRLDTSLPRRRVWKIDVERFTNELISRAHCLGRTPGFKPKDVDFAFWASAVNIDQF